MILPAIRREGRWLFQVVGLLLLERVPVFHFHSGGGVLSFLPAPLSVQEVLCQTFRWCNGIVFDTVAVPVYDVVRLCLRSDMGDDLFHCVLFVFRVF